MSASEIPSYNQWTSEEAQAEIDRVKASEAAMFKRYSDRMKQLGIVVVRREDGTVDEVPEYVPETTNSAPTTPLAGSTAKTKSANQSQPASQAQSETAQPNLGGGFANPNHFGPQNGFQMPGSQFGFATRNNPTFDGSGPSNQHGQQFVSSVGMNQNFDQFGQPQQNFGVGWQPQSSIPQSSAPYYSTPQLEGTYAYQGHQFGPNGFLHNGARNLYMGNQQGNSNFTQGAPTQNQYAPYGSSAQHQPGFPSQPNAFPSYGQNMGMYNGYDQFGDPVNPNVSKPHNSSLDDLLFPTNGSVPSTTVTTTVPVETPEVIAMREQMRTMQEQINRLTMGKGVEDLLNPNDVRPLPQNFKMPKMDDFDGSSCPRLHIQTYMMAMATKGCNEEDMAHYFHLSLKKPATGWYIDLKPEQRSTWDQIKAAFMEKYGGNVEWKVTRADVLATTQKPNESITDFYRRWNAKLHELKHPMELDDQIRSFKSCLKPNLRKAIGTGYFPDLRSMVSMGAHAENEIFNSTPATPTTPKDNGSNDSQSINNIQGGEPRRTFDDIGMSTEEAFDMLLEKGMIEPLKDYKPANPDAQLDESKYCRFHQHHGHLTNKCLNLKKIIQGFVDEGKIAKVQSPNIA